LFCTKQINRYFLNLKKMTCEQIYKKMELCKKNHFFCNDMAHTNNKADKCTRDMITHSAVCSAYPKGKTTKCLKEADFLFKECVKQTSGVNAGDASSSSYPKSNSSSMAENRYTGQASNGDIYNNGLLASFVSDNGMRYRVRRPGPRE
jgi:hypothetical protein